MVSLVLSGVPRWVAEQQIADKQEGADRDQVEQQAREQERQAPERGQRPAELVAAVQLLDVDGARGVALDRMRRPKLDGPAQPQQHPVDAKFHQQRAGEHHGELPRRVGNLRLGDRVGDERADPAPQQRQVVNLLERVEELGAGHGHHGRAAVEHLHPEGIGRERRLRGQGGLGGR